VPTIRGLSDILREGNQPLWQSGSLLPCPNNNTFC